MKIILLVAALTFHANPGGKSEFLAPEFTMKSVVAEDTPGSSEWYVPVDKLKLPTRWRITRNGHTVTNSSGGSRIAIAPTTGLWPRDEWNDVYVRDWYCGYDVANVDYVRLPGESDPEPRYFNLMSPEMFNLTWYTYVDSTNYRYSATACQKDNYEVSNLYPGRELFKPKSSRFDSVARSALLASYEAYYERLYYASQGQRNEWDPDDWGETSDPQKFDFNPVNDLIVTTPRFHPSYPTNAFEMVNEEVLRPVPASHRLLDADNITNLIYSVRKLFPALVQANGLDDETDDPFPRVMDARPFVFRPHWLTDQRDYPRNDYFGARLWWASTIPPPVSKQPIWREGSKVSYIESTTIGLFPEFYWKTVDELYTAGVPFSCYATTLDMLSGGDNFSPSSHYYDGPCCELFWAVISDCMSAYDGRLLDVNIFDVHGLTVPGFLTNCYPRAAASVPNRQDAYDRYVDVGTDKHISRRMVPGRLDLVNQLLSVMDRTIMIPSMHITSTNVTHAWRHWCDYQGDRLTVKVRWNGYSWDIISGIEDQYELSGTPELVDDKGEEVVDGIRASVSATHTTTNGTAIWGTGSSRGTLWLPDDQWHLPMNRPLTNVVIFVEEAAGVGIWAWIEDTASYSKIGYSGVPGSLEGSSLELEILAYLTPHLERYYKTSHPAFAENISIALGPHQPGFEAGNRVVDCKYAVLAAKTTDSLAFSPMWRSEVGSYDSGGLVDILASFGENRRTEVIGDIERMNGGSLTAPSDYIPLPDTVRLVFDNIPSTAEGKFDINVTNSYSTLVGTNTVHHFTLMPPGEVVTQRHTGQWDLELEAKVYVNTYYSVHTFDSNMVERVETWSETEGPYRVSPLPPVYHDYGTTIESNTPPDLVELVYTNDYPSTLVLFGSAVTNTIFKDSFNAYNTEFSDEWKCNSYVYEFDHTRDYEERVHNGLESYHSPVPMDPVTSNLTTAVGLTVTNNLPDDAIEYHADYIEYKADVEYVLIVDEEDKVSLYRHWRNPLTGEEFWKQQDQPFPIGNYFYECNLLVPGKLETGVGPEFDPCDESIFFRVMTQVDWLWNFMRIDK